MSLIKTIDEISRKYLLPQEDLARLGIEAALRERRKKLLLEHWEILSRYDSKDLKELESKLKQGEVPEHPAWEDIIEAKNIEAEVREIEDDLKALRAA